MVLEEIGVIVSKFIIHFLQLPKDLVVDGGGIGVLFGLKVALHKYLQIFQHIALAFLRFQLLLFTLHTR